MEEEKNKRIGIAIRKMRLEKKMTQQQLAEEMGLTLQTISKWETGKGIPDLNNVIKLAEIFGCTTDDLLRPAQESAQSEESTQAIAAEPEVLERERSGSILPVLYEVLENDGKEAGGGQSGSGAGKKKKKFSPFDFLSKKKMKATVGRVFGVEYENTFTKKFLFSDLRRKRTKREFEETLTQGMFTDDPSHTTLGLVAPWLYLRVFGFLVLCAVLGYIVSFFTLEPSTFLFFGGLAAVVPMILFLFEANYSRDVSVFSLMKYFSIGGISSILAVLVLQISTGTVLDTILIAPIFEEFCKAAVVVIILTKVKPKTALTGILIGFTVGAGFDMLENFLYAFNSYTTGVVEYFSGSIWYSDFYDVVDMALFTMQSRVESSFLVGHHYFTGIFAGLFVMFKSDTPYRFADLFRPKALAGLGISMALHALWNASAVIPLPFLSALLSILDIVLCFGGFAALVNIAIAQIRVMNIYEEKKTSESDAETFAEADDDIPTGEGVTV